MSIRRRAWKLLCIVMTVSFILFGAACGPGEDTSPTIAELPTDQIQETEKVEETRDAEEVSTTDTPVIAADIEKWRAPIGMMAILATSCESLVNTAEKRNAGEIDGMDAFAEILAAGILVNSVDENLPNWEPQEGQSRYTSDIQDHIDDIKNIIGPWVDQETDSSDVLESLPEICKDVQVTFEEILADAKEDGVQRSEIEIVLEEIASGIEEAFEGEEPEQEPIAAVTLANPEKGMGRLNPHAISELVNAPNWDLEVIEVIRGDEAWSLIENANMFNDPPKEGMEYALIKIHAKSTYTDDEEHSISSIDFNLTGDALIRYGYLAVVPPDPNLDATMYTGGETEGWVPFAVQEDEKGLILIFDELSNWDDDRYRYIALEDGASYDIPEELGKIKPNDLGTKRSSPAPYGERIVTDDWEVTVLEVLRGTEAWAMVEEANTFNDPPDEGMEYVLIHLKVRYIGENEHSEMIDITSFNSTGEKAIVYDFPSVVDPEPVLDVSLFPGGEYVGWITLLAEEGETGMMLIFEPPWDFSGENKRFLSLEP